MPRKVLITALLAGIAMTGAAYAGATQDGDAGPGADRGHAGWMMHKLDTDKDGTISKAEFEAKRAADFAAADTNHDGVVTPAELKAFHERKIAERKAEMEKRMFDRLDTNHDGKISKEEFEAAAMFDKLDKNHDGKITPDEMRWHGKGGPGRWGHGQHGDGDGPDGPPPPPPRE